MKIQHECRVTHVLWKCFICDEEFYGDTHFHICLKFRSSLGQTGQFLKLKIILRHSFCPVLSQDSKNVFCFDVLQLKVSKSRVSKKRQQLYPAFGPLHS